MNWVFILRKKTPKQCLRSEISSYSSVCAVIVTLGLERHQGPALVVPISDGWLDLLWEHCTFNCFCICDCLCGCLFLFITSVSRSTIFAADTFQWLTAPSSVFAPHLFLLHKPPVITFAVAPIFQCFQCSMFKSSFCLKDPPPHFLQYLNLSVQ